MSVVVARDETTAGHIVFPWPEAVPWGSDIVCSDDEVAIVCPNWQVGETLGPGRHTISPPNPQSHILAYFFRTSPVDIGFERLITAFDRAQNQPVRVHYQGHANIKVGNPVLMCHQLVGLPYHDLATGILRSAANSLGKVFQHVITKVCMSSPTVATIATPEAVAQLVQMAANANPMAIAVTGLELVGFLSYQLTIEGNEPIVWQDGAGPRQRHATDDDSEPTSKLPSADAFERVATGETDPTSMSGVIGGAAASGKPPQRAASEDTVRTDSPRDESGERPLGTQDKPLPKGTPVLVYWNDGLWRQAVIRQYEGGRYQIALEGVDTLAWVQANQVRPA